MERPRLFGIDSLVALLGAWQRWRVEFSLEATTLSRFSRGESVDSQSILRIAFNFGIDALVAVFGGWERWRVERPAKSVWNLRPSLLSTGAWIYCQDSFLFASAIPLARRHLPLADEPVLHPDVRLLAASCGIPRAWLQMTRAFKCFTLALVARLLQAEAPVLRWLLAGKEADRRPERELWRFMLAPD